MNDSANDSKNNSKYIFEVELEQITPYVNEIDGEGKDILRPTEFKPRFDKFLVRKYEKKQDIKEILLSVKKEDENKDKVKAFDYNITIRTNLSKDEYTKRKEYDFFMTAGGKNVEKYKAREKNITLKITFFSLNPKMIEMIKESLPEFLATTNFGKRKNKCYGSFYIFKNDKNYKDIDEIEILKEYKFFKTNVGNKEYLELKEDNIEEILEKLEFKAKIILKNGKGKKALILLRIDIHRKESLGAMKILKTKNDEYRLYFIPNIELIEELIRKKEIDKTKKTNKKVEYIGNPIYKPEVFDYEAFDKYIKEMKGE